MGDSILQPGFDVRAQPKLPFSWSTHGFRDRVTSFGASSNTIPAMPHCPKISWHKESTAGGMGTARAGNHRGNAGRWEVRIAPHRRGSCTLKCNPAFQCKCCERLGPIKACGQGGAWPRDTAPQGAQVSAAKEGRPLRDTRPLRHRAAQRIGTA